MEKVYVRPAEKHARWGGGSGSRGPQRLSDTAQRLDYTVGLSSLHHLNPDATPIFGSNKHTRNNKILPRKSSVNGNMRKTQQQCVYFLKM